MKEYTEEDLIHDDYINTTTKEDKLSVIENVSARKNAVK